MKTPAHNENGHRRRELTRRVKQEEHACALCLQPVDKKLNYLADKHGPRCISADCSGCVPDPMRGEVDEDLPRSRGGSPYDRKNCHLMHRKCNKWKLQMTLAEARAKYALHGATTAEKPVPSQIW